MSAQTPCIKRQATSDCCDFQLHYRGLLEEGAGLPGPDVQGVHFGLDFLFKEAEVQSRYGILLFWYVGIPLTLYLGG
jgi:hypothetical protein